MCDHSNSNDHLQYEGTAEVMTLEFTHAVSEQEELDHMQTILQIHSFEEVFGEELWWGSLGLLV